jgi:hypothetical protein
MSGSATITTACTPTRARQLLTILYEFKEGCRSAIGEEQAPGEEARLIQSAEQAYWWVAELRSKLSRARQSQRRKSHAKTTMAERRR